MSRPKIVSKTISVVFVAQMVGRRILGYVVQSNCGVRRCIDGPAFHNRTKGSRERQILATRCP
jgi:hypothetical protein